MSANQTFSFEGCIEPLTKRTKVEVLSGRIERDTRSSGCGRSERQLLRGNFGFGDRIRISQDSSRKWRLEPGVCMTPGGKGSVGTN